MLSKYSKCPVGYFSIADCAFQPGMKLSNPYFLMPNLNRSSNVSSFSMMCYDNTSVETHSFSPFKMAKRFWASCKSLVE